MSIKKLNKTCYNNNYILINEISLLYIKTIQDNY